LLAVIAVAVGAVPLYEAYARHRLFREIMEGSTAAIDGTPASNERLNRIVPRLIVTHQQASVAGQATSHPFNSRAFNARIGTWNGIILAWKLGGSREAEAYAKAHLASGQAASDEIANFDSATADGTENAAESTMGSDNPKEPGVESAVR
jgi:hypothetical protein